MIETPKLEYPFAEARRLAHEISAFTKNIAGKNQTATMHAVDAMRYMMLAWEELAPKTEDLGLVEKTSAWNVFNPESCVTYPPENGPEDVLVREKIHGEVLVFSRSLFNIAYENADARKKLKDVSHWCEIPTFTEDNQ